MCGIAGVLQLGSALGAEQMEALIADLIAPIERRGPDAKGTWLCQTNRLALGHRRLAILDLSPEGAQPMISPSGRYVIVFNGEIYNYRTIGRELSAHGYVFRGHSDTEVLLAGIEHWGLDDCLKKCSGMFALALWDRQERVLQLARDRLGEKPLYYGVINGLFLFGSELKSFRASSLVSPTLKVSSAALAAYLRYGYVPDPLSIYQEIFKLSPGSIISFSPAAADQAVNSERPFGGMKGRAYWSANEHSVAASANARGESSEQQTVDQLESLLRQAVEDQMIADVPLGAFLSGGVDSSTVVALMQSASSSPVKTFTIGFDQKEFNESEHAAAVAKHLGTDHTELRVSSRDCLDVVPQLGHIYDEPFADSSQVPMFLVAGLAKRSVTVALSGDGGDELFCGYNRYFLGRDVERIRSIAPRWMRRTASSMLEASSGERVHELIRLLSRVAPSLASLNSANVSLRTRRLASALRSESTSELYGSLLSCWQDPSIAMIEPHLQVGIPGMEERSRGEGVIESFMLADLLGYLPGDNLVKVDRAAMYHSLETRVPMLDRSVVEFALSLPLEMKFRNGVGKWVLRQVLYRYVPRELIDRPKMGFSVPIVNWLAGDLREWAECLLDNSSLEASGVFRASVVRRCWDNFLAGRSELAPQLWAVLMFQQWYFAQ